MPRGNSDLPGRRLALIGAGLAWLFACPARADESFLSPGSGEVLSAGATVEVRWASACSSDADHESDEAELVLSLDGGLTFPVRVSPEISPCASHFTWRVPALMASQARLALRTGENEGEESEELALVSEPFVILPDPDGHTEPLYERSAEWWTPQAPAALEAEDLLDETVCGAPARLAPIPPASEASETPVQASTRPARRTSAIAAAALVSATTNTRSLASHPGALIPLRQ